jgi:hypothetical protein
MVRRLFLLHERRGRARGGAQIFPHAGTSLALFHDKGSYFGIFD